jgi:hypothetical protein
VNLLQELQLQSNSLESQHLQAKTAKKFEIKLSPQPQIHIAKSLQRFGLLIDDPSIIVMNAKVIFSGLPTLIGADLVWLVWCGCVVWLVWCGRHFGRCRPLDPMPHGPLAQTVFLPPVARHGAL